MPRGRKAAPKPYVAPPNEALTSDNLAAVMARASAAQSERLVRGMYEKACGVLLWREEDAAPAGVGRAVPREKYALVNKETGEELDGWVYRTLPCPLAAKLIYEHDLGRPGVREVAKNDPVIQLIHRVPGKRDVVTPLPEGVELPEETPEEVDPVTAMGLGLAAAGLEPEDDAGDE